MKKKLKNKTIDSDCNDKKKLKLIKKKENKTNKFNIVTKIKSTII